MSEQFTLIGDEDTSGKGGQPLTPGIASQFDAHLAAPLADRMRPRSLDQFFGQRHLLGETSTLRSAIEKQLLHSMVFWGPPGTG